MFFREKKQDKEEVFRTNFNSQKKAVDFFTIEKEESCIPIDSPVFYIKNKNEIMILYRGYFFLYKKEKRNEYSHSIIGIPSNNREYWEVNGVYENSSINKAYNNFLNEFEYGGENLSKTFLNKGGIDKENSIEYFVEFDRLTIEKSDPMGVIHISFKRKDDNVSFTYKLNYPEY